MQRRRRRRRLGIAVLFLGAVAAATTGTLSCKREDKDKKPPPPTPPLPALASPTPTIALPVPGFRDAVVAVPVGVTKPVPVLVAVLGIGDTPEDQCATWREIVGTRAFVLCPRGAPHMVSDDNPDDDDKADETKDDVPDRSGRVHQSGFYPIDVATLERELTAGLKALKARFPAHVADKEIVYSGFSRGAFLGPSLVAKQPTRFTSVILIEGGQSAWHNVRATGFAKGGGKRVLFACGQPSCVEETGEVATMLRGAKIETRIVHGVGEGHGYRKQVKEELRRSFDWVIEGDPMWTQAAAATAPRAVR